MYIVYKHFRGWNNMNFKNSKCIIHDMLTSLTQFINDKKWNKTWNLKYLRSFENE